ncbi:hypothetical protein [Elizabethkingia miricola]|uniref:hypothetical protein n=1 Tax=Elizabethkingia miricola TaxID=172045 RepID=UPI000B35C93C|nr:hypothetical protein [Elizabethkingia miricola]NHQ65551.1 hypothetical protein [Elizabethkingia miricola]NHQ69001.1 hypothetical protein [Elizabethkingia miricola]NHQ76213.1 hypothetical protein [Elizabethkingia miricola]PSL90229.1 hypothetical protein C7V10_00820 [Elizabethkingia miricola]QHQ86982.1 hypothetical protein FE632_09410 [Elizabethkingia miricola]
MKKLLYTTFLASTILSSCSGAFGFRGVYAQLWNVDAQKEYIMTSNTSRNHKFDLINTSTEDSSFKIYTPDHKLYQIIKKGEKAHFTDTPFNGIIIENTSSVNGNVQFYAYIQEKGYLTAPTVKISEIKK